MIKKAIIPAAGNGTRVGEITKLIPKELLPLNGEFALTHVIKELNEAGIEEILLVTNQEKIELIKKYVKIKDSNLKIIVQKKPNGMTGAVLAGDKFIDSDDFLLYLPDDFIYGENPTKNMLKKFRGNPMVSLVEVEENEVEKYGIAEIRNKKIEEIKEKPKLSETNSRKAIFGRFIITQDLYKLLHPENNLTGTGLSGAFNTYLIKEKTIDYIELDKDKRLDIGSYKGLIEANNAFLKINQKLPKK